MELCIDTSTRYAAVGLSREGETLAELAWRSERNHSVELVPAIQTLMRQARVETDQIEAIFVAKGPGGFSALRVGMSTAKALAVALAKPLVSVATLDIEAQPYIGLGSPVCALIEAGRNRLYVGRYAPTADAATPAFGVVGHDEFASTVDADTLFCGEGVRAVADLLRDKLGSAARVVDVPPPTRRVSVLARLACRRWKESAIDDPAALQPLYLRSSQIDMARRTRARTQ